MANSGLVVRRTERFEISLPGRFRVAMHQIESVQFAKGVTDEDRWVDINITDFGLGGVGFMTPIILPRGLDLELQIFENLESKTVMYQCQVQTKRVQMVDRRPGYQIGCAYGDIDEEGQVRLDAIIERFEGLSDDHCG